MSGTGAATALEAVDLRAGYLGHSVIFGPSLRAEAGRITALFGHNGAGKTTMLKGIAGLLSLQAGKVRLFGEDVTDLDTSDRVRRGVVYLPQERAVFTTLSVRDNLELGAALVKGKQIIDERMEAVFALFPRLSERSTQLAGTMSGGEQRMLTMGIALMAGARVLMLDEPSLGLAPLINQSLLQAAQRLARDQGIAVLLVEQAIGQALDFVDKVYVMRSGQIVAEHSGDEARQRDDWWKLF